MLTVQHWNKFSIKSTKCLPFPPLDIAFCVKTLYSVAKWHVTLFGINYISQIVYYTKQLKQIVQFLHAVALLSIYVTKIVQRKSPFFTEHTHLLKTKLPREPESGIKKKPNQKTTQHPKEMGMLLVKHKHGF